MHTCLRDCLLRVHAGHAVTRQCSGNADLAALGGDMDWWGMELSARNCRSQIATFSNLQIWFAKLGCTRRGSYSAKERVSAF